MIDHEHEERTTALRILELFVNDHKNRFWPRDEELVRDLKLLKPAARACIELKLDPEQFFGFAKEYYKKNYIRVISLSAIKFLKYVQDNAEVVDYTDLLIKDGFSVDPSVKYTEDEFLLISGCKELQNWLELNFDSKKITPEALVELSRARTPFDPIIIYACGSYIPEIRDRYRGEVQASIDQNSNIRAALQRLGWCLVGVTL